MQAIQDLLLGRRAKQGPDRRSPVCCIDIRNHRAADAVAIAAAPRGGERRECDARGNGVWRA